MEEYHTALGYMCP